jgi:hypothetical protein
MMVNATVPALAVKPTIKPNVAKHPAMPTKINLPPLPIAVDREVAQGQKQRRAGLWPVPCRMEAAKRLVAWMGTASKGTFVTAKKLAHRRKTQALAPGIASVQRAIACKVFVAIVPALRLQKANVV